MEEKTGNLRVSKCHTAGFTSKKVSESIDTKAGEVAEVLVTVCDVCKQPCQVVEMIVDDIEASDS